MEKSKCPKRNKEKVSALRKEVLPQKQPVRKDLLKRVLNVRNAIAACGLAAVAIMGSRACESEAPKGTPKIGTVTALKPSSVPISIIPQIIGLHDPRAVMPEVTVNHNAVPYKPKSFVPKIPPEKLVEISQKFAPLVKDYYHTHTAPALRAAKTDVAQIQAAMIDFVDYCFKYLEAQDHRIPEPVFGVPDKDDIAKKAYVLLNNFLLNHGFMVADQGYRYMHYVNLVPVKIEEVDIKVPLTGEKMTIPLIISGKPLEQIIIPGPYLKRPLEYEPMMEAIIWPENDNADNLESSYKFLKQRGYSMPPLEQLLKPEYFLPAIKHEAMHHYLLSKYPNDKTRRGDEPRDLVNVKAQMGNGEEFKIQGAFHPISFHEFACRGVDLMEINEQNLNTSRLSFPLLFGQSADFVYDLQRSFLMKAFEEAGKDPMDVALKSSVEKLNQVGRQMYALGMALLENRKTLKP